MPNFVGQLPLPLLGQRRAAQHGQPGRVALVEQLGGDQAGLDGLADADVVGDQQPDRVLPQRHQQRHELVGAGLDGEPGQRAERPGAGPEPDPQRRAQQPGADAVPASSGSGGLEGGRADLLQRGEDAGDLVVAAAERAQHEEVGRLGLGQHDPLAAAGLHQRAHLERRKLSRRHRVPSPVRRTRSGSGPRPPPSRRRARCVMTLQPRSRSTSRASSSRPARRSSSVGPSTKTAAFPSGRR